MGSIEAIELEIGKVNATVEALSLKIEKAEGKVEDAENAGNTDAVQRWFTELQQLREEKNRHLRKEEQLRDEKARLQSAGLSLLLSSGLTCAVALRDCAKEQAAASEASGVLTFDRFQECLQAGLQPIEKGLQGMLSELQKRKERRTKSFSKVGSAEAQNLLAQLDFAEEVGNLEDPIDPPPDVPVAEAFDYSLYPSEDAGTPDLLKHHQQQLQKYGVSFGRGAFQMYDIHDNKELYSLIAPDESSEFTGTADVLLAPFGLYLESAARQGRALFEHKQTEEKKQSFRDNNPTLAGGSGKDAGPPGPVQYKAHKGQALVCYLASLKSSPFPLIYDLCDGETHNLLHLRDGFITVWESLSPTQAYWKLAQLLLHRIPAANDKRLSLDALPEEFQVPLKKLRGIEPSSQILEQLESILPFVHESERVACAQELLAPWLQSSKIPEFILHMYN